VPVGLPLTVTLFVAVGGGLAAAAAAPQRPTVFVLKAYIAVYNIHSLLAKSKIPRKETERQGDTLKRADLQEREEKQHSLRKTEAINNRDLHV